MIPLNSVFGKDGNDSGPAILKVTHFFALVEFFFNLCVCHDNGTNEECTDRDNGIIESVMALDGGDATMVISEYIQVFVDNAGIDFFFKKKGE